MLTSPRPRAPILLLFVLSVAPANADEPAIVIPASPHPVENAQSVAYSSDGRLVAAGFGGPMTGHDDTLKQFGRIEIWDAATGKRLKSVAEHGDIVGLQFTSDGKACLASRVYTPGDSVDANISRLIPLGEGEASLFPFGRNSYIAAVSPTEPQLAIVQGRDIARIFEGLEPGRKSGDARVLSTVDSYSGRCLAFSPDGGIFAAVHGRQEPIVRNDGTVILKARAIRIKGLTLFETATWSVQDSAVSDELFNCSALAVSPEARWLATGHPNGIVRVWDGRSLTKTHEFNLQTAASVLPRFSPDGQTLALLTQPSDGPGLRYSRGEGKYQFNGEKLGTACELKLYQAGDWKLLRTFRFDAGAFATYHANLPAASRNPARLAFSPDSQQILVGCNGVILLDAETGETIRQFAAPHAAP